MSNVDDILVNAKRIENALNGTAQAYVTLGAAMMELSAAISDFFIGLASTTPEAKIPDPKTSLVM